MPVVLGTTSLSGGVATLVLPSGWAASGTYSLKADYGGSATHMASTSPTYSHVVSAGGDPINDGLVSYWPFNEATGAGSVAADAKGVSNFTGLSAANFSGTYYLFGGFDWGIASDTAAYNFSSQLTVFCWVQATTLPFAGIANFISQYDNTTNNRAWRIGVDPSNHLFVTISTDGTAAGSGSSATYKEYAGSITCISTSAWHSVAFRFDGASSLAGVNGVLDLFVDGARDTSVNKSAANGSFSVIFNSPSNLIAGGIGTTSSPVQTFNGGELQRVRLYNTFKSDSDIAAIHALGHA